VDTGRSSTLDGKQILRSETLATCANRTFRGGRSAPIYFLSVVVEKPGGLIRRQLAAELRDEAAGESASPVRLKRRVPTRSSAILR
jgi:hypothetical protein